MSRTIPSAIDGVLDDAFVIPIFFVELDFDTDPLYVHTDLGSITTLGRTWLGTGGLGEISPIEETEEQKAPGLKLRMAITSEASGSIFQELTQQDYYQRPVVIYFSTRDTITGALEASPFEVFRGKADVAEITHGFGTSYVDLLVESEWADGERANAQIYSDSQLQAEYSGDLGFEFLTHLVNAKVVWGSDRTINIGGINVPRRARIPSFRR